MNPIRIGSAIVAVLASGALAACGSSGTDLSTTEKSTSPAAGATTAPTTTTTTSNTSTANYHPKIDPAKFTNHITNPYLPFKPGTTHRYKGTRDGVPTATKVTVTNQTKDIMGVRCVVVKDVVTSNHTLVEKTTDWYAQDDSGTVWYFGEDTAEYANGVVITTAGTWEAGVDNAQPGIVMQAHPKPGPTYRQEYRPGVAEDKARVLSLNGSARVPAGNYKHLVVTFDENPLDPSKKEHKWYKAGVGVVQSVLKGGGHSDKNGLVK